MPWMECSVMDERVRFVGRLLDGGSMSDVCRSFGKLPTAMIFSRRSM